uniref:TGB2 n=1 Tax=Garlic virus A TaxID=12433 RepID=A0A6M2YWU2_9VIRU|nr:TGB2 [Garlic virus A]QED44369.1 TGB2 [Garlic virus A]QED44375.1 TGB2 [Garlic virus A]
MSFAPPPDYSKVYITLAGGAALGILVYAFRANHLPHVGDNTHHLPHGGRYCDGNKQVHYFKPNSGSRSGESYIPPLIIFALTLAILLLSRPRRRICVRCSEPH